MAVKSIIEFGGISKKYAYDVIFDEDFKSEVVSSKRIDEISSESWDGSGTLNTGCPRVYVINASIENSTTIRTT